MRIITFRKKIHFIFFWLTFFSGLGISFSQCPTIANPNQSFCDIESPTVSSLVATNNGNGIFWYTTAVATTPLSGSTNLINGEDYFADDASGSCGTRQSVVVTIYSAPTGQNFQGVCVDNPNNATISNLIAIGNDIKWYSTPSGGIPLAPTTVLTDNTIYYATQTNPDTGCQTSRFSVFVNVGVVSVPTGNAVQQFCNIPGSPATVADLVASGNNNWYLTAFSAVPLAPTTPLINGQSYFATRTDPPCESDNRFEVVVALFEPNDPGISGTEQICEDQIASTPPFDLFNELGGTPDTTGTWYGPLTTANGHLGTVNVSSLSVDGSPFVFTYSVSSSPSCPVENSTVTITIIPLPVVTIASDATICLGDSATVTFTGTANATVTYTINGGANQTIVLNASGTATITNTYASTTTFDLVSVASSGTPSCSQPQTGSVTITVLPLPVVTIASDATICLGDSATVTFTGTANATVTYTINGGANQTIVLNASGTATITNTYASTSTFDLVSIASSGTPSCSQPQTGSVTITVLPLPVVTIASDATICLGDSATVTFTGTANATVTYTINGGANQTIVLNASGTATITNTYASTTTFDLVSIASSGTPSCSQPQTGSVTITVLPLPVVTIASDATICLGDSATVTFTGTANATVTYTINGGANQTIVLNASGNATITNTYASTTTFDLVSVASSGTPSCSQPQTGSVTITVLPLPVVTIASDATICLGDSATVTFTGTANAAVTYTINGGANQTIVLNASGTATITNTYASTSTFDLVSVASSGTPSCSQPQTGSVTINVTPAPIAGNDVTDFSICSNGNSQDLFLLLGVSAQTGGTWSPTMASESGIFNPTIDSEGIYTYTVTGTPPCLNATASVTVTIVPAPNAGNDVPDLSLCSNNSSLDLFTLLGASAQLGGIWSPTMASGSGIFNPAIDPTGVYTYTLNNSLCGTDSATVTISVTAAPNSGANGATLLINSCVTIDSVDLFAGLNGSQGNGTWNDDDATGALNANIFNPSTVGVGTYHFTYTVNGTGSCISDAATVTVVVAALPNAVGATVTANEACLNSSNELFISNATNLADGTYTINYQLSDANTASGIATLQFISGSASFIIPASQLANPGSVTVTITQLTSGTTTCGINGNSFNPITFAVIEVGTPELISQGNEFCIIDNPTIADLTANTSGTETIVWYDAAVNGTAFSNADLLQNGATYFAGFISASGCESAVRLQVIVDLTVCDAIVIPDGFSPNGDGVNDEFDIANVGILYPNFKLEVYNRYGNIIYKGNKNSPNWDGTSSQGGIKVGNNVVPVGVYFYILEFNNGEKKPVQGRVYLSR